MTSHMNCMSIKTLSRLHDSTADRPHSSKTIPHNERALSLLALEGSSAAVHRHYIQYDKRLETDPTETSPYSLRLLLRRGAIHGQECLVVAVAADAVLEESSLDGNRTEPVDKVMY